MAKVNLSKSGLQKERENLKLYRKVLPSLDLKRRQLLGEQRRAEKECERLEEELAAFPGEVGRELPMLGAEVVDFSDLLRISGIRKEKENVVGVTLPKLEGIDFEVADYSLLGKPHWVDRAIVLLREWVEKKVGVDIAGERVSLLEQAARKITQRVNLFEKILIPNAEKNIQRIQIYLADMERAAVVQSKIAKSRARRRSAGLQEEEEVIP